MDAAETARLLASRVPETVPVSVRVSARARGIVLRMLPGKGLEVVAPAGVGAGLLLQAVEARRDWIDRISRRMAAEGGLPGQGPVAPRPSMLVLTAFSRQWKLSYLAREMAGCLVSNWRPTELVVSGAVSDPAAVSAALSAFCRRRAGELLRLELARVSEEIGLGYSAVSIRAQRTRWGSCTAKGRINLNYTIAFLPPELCRLVLVHELCHTVELNHSARFWDVVEKYVPDCRAMDARLNSARHYLPLWLEGAATAAPA